ncbi:phosphoglycerate kinase [Saccharothrix luteola]|uniref:phosphoglycerate kinase n=1 Tax=Saccharothrix luteola TaxID=2893018 RepID=UPI001E5422D8|nr:phosphoglycerate kinase [Saccharothrix luteola]MCC8250102.1 phosphoglycerate kinase [Saccharothrix luteola]
MRCDGVPLLSDVDIRPGDRWIYSAGFNVRPDLAATARIDEELPDLRRILGAGGRIAILSHQGSHRDRSAASLDFVAEYLSDRLGTVVEHHPDNDTADAVDRARRLRPGEAVLFGNTREHAGEEGNDPGLARRFAALGDAVAVGGFSKAHRAHASNVGLLDHLPGYLADSVVAQLALLAPWSGASTRYSVAVLGGVKREKTTPGLDALAQCYDLVVPGGAVLNGLLRATGHRIGASAPGDAGAAERVLARDNRAEIHLPREVVVADRDLTRFAVVPVRDGVPPGWSIVDFVPRPWLHDRLDRLAAGGRALLAGTPCLYAHGFRRSADVLLAAFRAPSVDALLLGGDTVAELPWYGPASTGGGAALHFLGHGTLPVLDALRRTGGVTR